MSSNGERPPIAALIEFERRIGLLDARVRSAEEAGEPALLALEELHTAGEELRVAEEEIQAQSDRILHFEGQLEDERRRYQDLFDFLPDAYLLTDASAVILDANLAAGRMLGIHPKRLTGKPLVLYVMEVERDRFLTRVGRISRGSSGLTMEYHVETRDHRIIPVEARVDRAYTRDGQASFRWLMRPLEQPVQSTSVARAMMETHHRVKNNLQVLAAMIDMRLLDEDVPVNREDFRRLSASVRSLATMHDILTQETKSGGGGMTVSSKKLIAGLLPLLSQSAGGKAVRSEIADVPLSARQATALSLILNELVSNAIKHGKKGTEIRLSAYGSEVHLSVCDSGDGFPAGFDHVSAAHTGLELVTSLGRWDLAGTVEFGNTAEGGGEVTLRFPLCTG